MTLDNNSNIHAQSTPTHDSGFPLQLGHEIRKILDRKDIKNIQVYGTHSPMAIAALISGQLTINTSEQISQVILVPNFDDIEALSKCISFFNPNKKVHVLPGYDVTPYSNLYPSPAKMSARLSWLWSAQSARNDDIFLATPTSISQRCIPFNILSRESFILEIDQEVPENFANTLDLLGYTPSPIVEDVGSYSIRGGTIDIFSPSSQFPVRIELFADVIESLRFYDPVTQRSFESAEQLCVIPARETLYSDDNKQNIALKLRESCEERNVDREDLRQILHSITQGVFFHGVEFLLPFFYDKFELPLHHFCSDYQLWKVDSIEQDRVADELRSNYQTLFRNSQDQVLCLNPKEYLPSEEKVLPSDCSTISFDEIDIRDHTDATSPYSIQWTSAKLQEFQSQCKNLNKDIESLSKYIKEKFSDWKEHRNTIFIAASTSNQRHRITLLLERAAFSPITLEDNFKNWSDAVSQQQNDPKVIHLVPRQISESVRFVNESVIFIRELDFFGKSSSRREYKSSGSLQSRANSSLFADLKVGDLIVHKLHGIGTYEGLKTMPIQGIDSEFIQLQYKDGDKLYLPVYRIGQIQKYASSGSTKSIDKLGGTQWNKVKTKVKKQVQDIASELLKLYAKRAQITRPSFSKPDNDYISFENSFPFSETDDQLKAINEVLMDMTGPKPMDRLVCGDVGFGKTEIAMRAAFKAVQDSKQVAIIAPTTILTFQHTENFKKRFKSWPVTIKSLNRFVTKKELKKTLEGLKSGAVDIVIGTHRLLSKDVSFKDLGLLVIDEEQKFGVKHKERIRHLKTSVDTLTMSATPIPRTLNLSLVGLRDLSLITTPPVDRLPTRTFVCKYNKETTRKAIESELARGGQVFFLHNRVSSIYTVASELRELVPNAKIGIGHGQMEEKELEKTMLDFFNQDIDILVCTTIIESGMDIPKANTMFIDNAHALGLSQLYQLRGRVGRSKSRAYCYLLVPNHKKIEPHAVERLKVIQENTALGSGISIAQHDLELRGSGDILGQEQSGHINAIGYEMYLELLEDAISEAKGEPPKSDAVEPEINIRISALIPDKYIPDIRVRLSYYKALSTISEPEDLDRIEEELHDQYGKPPEQVLNLMGLMLIRKYCKDLGIKDISSSSSMITFSFTESTPLPAHKIVELASRENKKYAITPDYRLKVRMKTITWPNVYDEMMYLLKLC